MTRNELIAKVATATERYQKDVKPIVEAYEKVIMETLKEGEEVNLNGFLKYYTVDVPEKTGVSQLGKNKGETWVKPAHKAVKVKVLKTLKECLE